MLFVDELWIMVLASKERKEVVVIGTDDDDEDEEDCCNQRDASVSGVGELRNILRSGTHASISVCFCFLPRFFYF